MKLPTPFLALFLGFASLAPASEATPINADAALKKLKAGNQRYSSGHA
ncbi:MAG: hypothetical protein JWL90_2926, partial [Chthoniobacteraceae bacterium]|nr:hypothetical protein [Chthoniobacteraceae bacterium]